MSRVLQNHIGACAEWKTVLAPPTPQAVRGRRKRKHGFGIELRVIAGLLYRNPAMTYTHTIELNLLPKRTRNAKTSLDIAPNHFRSAPERENRAGHRSKLLSRRSRNAKTSLGIAPNCFRSAPATPESRWASLQIAFDTLPKRKNLAGHRSKLFPKRSRNAQTLLGIAPNCSRSAPETPTPRWASLQIAFGSTPKRPNLAGESSSRVPLGATSRKMEFCNINLI